MGCSKCNSHVNDCKNITHGCNNCEDKTYLANKKIINSDLDCGSTISKDVVIATNSKVVDGKLTTVNIHALDCVATCEDIVNAKAYTDLKVSQISIPTGGTSYQLKNLQDTLIANGGSVATQVDIDGQKAYTDLKVSQISTGGGSTYVLNDTSNNLLASGSKVLTQVDATKVLNDAKAYTDSQSIGGSTYALNSLDGVLISSGGKVAQKVDLDIVKASAINESKVYTDSKAYSLKSLQDVNLSSDSKVATQVDLDSTLANAKAYTDSKAGQTISTSVKLRSANSGEVEYFTAPQFSGSNKSGITAPYMEIDFSILPANAKGIFVSKSGYFNYTDEMVILCYLHNTATDRVAFFTNATVISAEVPIAAGGTYTSFRFPAGEVAYDGNSQLPKLIGKSYSDGSFGTNYVAYTMSKNWFIPFKVKANGARFLEVGIRMPNNDGFSSNYSKDTIIGNTFGVFGDRGDYITDKLLVAYQD